LSGGRFEWAYQGRWWRFVEQPQWPLEAYRRQASMGKWDENVSDCRQEIVFIGQRLDVDALKSALNGCLLSEEAILAGPKRWVQMEGGELALAPAGK